MALLLAGKRILQSRNLLIPKPKNISFIVLLPEIYESANDEFTQNNGLPVFSNFTIENCTASIAKQALQFESGVKTIEKVLGSKDIDIVEDVIQPLETLSVPLELTWGISKTLYLGNNTQIPTKTYLPIHERARQARSAKYNNIKIYEAFKKELSKEKEWNSEIKQVLDKFSLEGKLNGLDLDQNGKDILREIMNKLMLEKQIFKEKIDLQTQKFSHTVEDYNVVRDFPKELLESMSSNSKDILSGPWTITLQPNIYMSAMQHCPDRKIRWNLWQALTTRGSGYLEKEKSTGLHIEEIRYKRYELAKLLGYQSFADMSMETKMAGSVENVKNTLNTLLEKAKPAQDAEIKNLHEFAVNNGFGYEVLELWDLPYWRKKEELLTYNYNPEEYKEYFPFPTVLQGLFNLCEKLFNIVIKQRNDVSTWNKDVKFYDIFETHQSAPVAGFYLDPYASRENTIRNGNSNGWMVGIQNKSGVCDKIPLASLIFNFEALPNGGLCHLSVKDVNSLFYRFGHALQHLLTRTTFSEVSGLSNVEWDVVEVCGHVFSHFLYTKDVIESISCNSKTGEKLPAHLTNSLLEVRNHMAGFDLCKELYLSALDLEMYSKKDHWLKIARHLWPQFRSFPLDKYDSHPCSFTQIFTEEWAAAYYSHVWSKMIAADVYSAFQESQGDGQVVDVAKRYRETFLALGGSVHSSKVFRHFRGRDPSPQALLSCLGLSDNK